MDIHTRVRDVALELVSAGVWPTVQEVRARLGTGSNTTINNTLRQWRQEFLGKMASSARHPEWSPALAQAFAQVWQQACGEAEQNLAGLREEAQQEVARLVAELAQAQRELAAASTQQLALSQRCDSAEQERQQLAASLTQLQQALAAQEARALASEAALQEARGQIVATQQAADQRVEVLEARHAVQLQQLQQDGERREALAYERLEGMRIQLYQQVEDERTLLRQREQQWQAERQQLAQQLATLRDSSQQQLAQRAQENGRLAAELAALQGRLADSDTLRQQWQQRHAELAAAEQQRSSALQQLQQEQALLQQHRLPHLLLWLQAEQAQLAAMPAAQLAEQVRRLLAG
ncbi:DNA-binding protein [Vogesella indigofera]|uniref:DNA-binding protein n=1 Tax=Vogesella indigofera TaxID=45465 RepID=UPI00234F4803|nr:DNA-binding protein [Vogesella indigofera]MDC7706836.1 DNA-binding protein [Vogesella indigofera]